MMDAPHVLVIDDDARLRGLLQEFLASEGFRVSVAGSAKAARQLTASLAFDALVVDVMMPGESGLSFVSTLREKEMALPVLMLSALSDSSDRIAGLTSGSDDYLAKPFEPQELLLRLKGLLRRAATASEVGEEAGFGPFKFNILTGELRRGLGVVRLTSGERELLRKLGRAQGRAVSRDMLAGEGSLEATRKIDVQINRLRQKIEADPSDPRYLQTQRGQGYVLVIGN